MPFIVKANNKAEVKVLGTHFNVSAYPDESTIKTTLLEGRVQVSSLLPVFSSSRLPLFLSPGQQASLDANGILSVKEVDTDLYTAWKDGKLYFNACTLEDLMRTLSRWYDFKVDYNNPKLKTLRFTGVIEKSKPIEYGLSLINYTTAVSFKIEGKKNYDNVKMNVLMC